MTAATASGGGGRTAAGTWLQRRKSPSPAFWHDRRWNAPNQPVVGVSFWEAEACCAWAGGRLPQEQEWEAAARGREGHAYPWGNDWQDGICNTGEAGLGVTSPVGLFPRARQAELGIEDLAGNVWEWCGSLYDPSESKTRMRPVCCAAGPGATIRSARARPTASGTTRTTGTTTSVFGWCVRPHLRALITESAAQAAPTARQRRLRVFFGWPFDLAVAAVRSTIGVAGRHGRWGRPLICPRVLRGGSWNNNQDNARSANRNRNNPNNRNNNIGFRVVCSSTSFCSFHGKAPSGAWRACRVRDADPVTLPELSADHGLRAEARKERWRGRVPSARLGRVPGRRAHREQGRRPDSAPPAPRLSRAGAVRCATSCLLGLEPAAEQPADLADHAARMRVLPVAQPAPAVGEAQIDAQAPERGIGVAQRRQSAAAAPAPRPRPAPPAGRAPHPSAAG